MMNTPNGVRDYFSALVAGSGTNPQFSGGLDIKAFYFGSSTRLIEATRSKINYPVMHVSVPEYYPNDNGAGDYDAECRFDVAILSNCTRDDYQAQDDAWNTNYRIILRILSVLYSDRIAQQFYLNLTAAEILPISEYFADNMFGYMVSLRMAKSGFLNICPANFSVTPKPNCWLISTSITTL